MKKLILSLALFLPLASHAMSITNIGLSSAIINTNDLKINLKTKSGSDPSSLDPVEIAFRNNSGSYDVVSITSALSITLPDGAKLAIPNGEENYLYVYALNNSGVAELAVTSERRADNSLQTTLIGDATADGHGLYSNPARTNVPIRLLGVFKLARSGTGFWLPVLDTQVVPFNIRREVHCLLARVSGVWQCLDSNAHRMIGVSSVTNGSSYATINFNFVASNVLTAQTSADETYMKNGIICTWQPLAVNYITIWFYQLQAGVWVKLTSAQAQISGAQCAVTVWAEE